tara:strand:+ start:313 stop:510 length:198 start_codon:yes stop_codon:yes gene_type:complete
MDLDLDQSTILPKSIVAHFLCLYEAIEGNQLTPEENPINRVPITISQLDGKLVAATPEDERNERQ